MECEHRLEKSKMKTKVCCKYCYRKQYNKDNVERIKQQKKQWDEDNIERLKQYRKQYRKDNTESIKQWRKDNPEKMKQYRKDNAEHKRQYLKQYRKDNVERINQYQKQYTKQRRHSDQLYKMICNMRSRLKRYSKLKGDYKTNELIGCSPVELRDWLEGQFQEGMSWDNNTKNGWHIDHILPLCVAETTEDLKILAHYTNLQPLWGIDNIKKGGR